MEIRSSDPDALLWRAPVAGMHPLTGQAKRASQSR